MINLLTFDVEEWFRANYPSVSRRGQENPPRPTAGFREEDVRLDMNVKRILDLCAQYGAKATFFVLGQTAKRYPRLVHRIMDAGHEIASHGYEHALVYKMTPEAFRTDLRKSLELLESLTGAKILGYRAPSWSVFLPMSWFFDELKKNGLIYDSSLFPARNFLYGDKTAPRFPHPVDGLVEIPASTLAWLGHRVPFASGFFFRVSPLPFIRMGIRALHRKKQPVMVCLHPREVDPEAPKPIGWSWRDRWVHSFGTRGAARKLEHLLEEFSFSSIRDFLSCGSSKSLGRRE